MIYVTGSASLVPEPEFSPRQIGGYMRNLIIKFIKYPLGNALGCYRSRNGTTMNTTFTGVSTALKQLATVWSSGKYLRVLQFASCARTGAR